MDPVIAAEQTHLDESRRALRRMRSRTDAAAAAGGDRFSNEYLKYTLYQRMKALEDDPEVPLFFGRLDYDDDAGEATGEPDGGPPGERFYIGRRHVSDESGNPMVVDWRARISRPFYLASAADSLGVRRRRRFGFERGVVTAFEDEGFDGGRLADAHSELLEAEIERPRIGPMRDIVATIQPEQDDIVRADIADSVCVQGAPGTGKTAVGLHRAAYLLYAHRDQLRRQGVLVVGPNESFLRYIGDVLPALGEIDARQTTVPELVARVVVRAVDDVATARVKGDARMATVVERALWSFVRPAEEGLVVPIGARRWRIPAYEADEIVAALRSRGVRYGAGRAMLAQRLAHAVLVKMELAGEAPDDRVQDRLARSRPVRAHVDRLWPAVEPERLVMRLLGEPDFLTAAADGVLTTAEQELIRWARPAKGPRSARWSLHDAVVVDEAADLLERQPSLGHVVLDEAQDLSPMMLRCVGRHCSTGSVTVLGDLAQATTPWGVQVWPQALAHLGKPGARIRELNVGFRVPGEVIDYAARLLPLIAPDLRRPSSVRRTRGELVIERSDDPVAAAVRHVVHALAQEGSVGVIAPAHLVDETTAALTADGIMLEEEPDAVSRVQVVSAAFANGLEFDHVVLIEPAAIAAAETDEVTGLRRLYVCLTRAVTSLALTHSQPIPIPADAV